MKLNTYSFCKKINVCALSAVVVAGLMLPSPSFAQTTDTSTEMSEKEMQAQVDKIMETLNPQTGEVSLQGGEIKLSLGDKYYFLDSAASQKVLVDLWGNVDDGTSVLGMIFPKEYTPLDGNAWGATLEFVEEGYVKDEDAADIDYDDMLNDMQKSTAAASKQRIKAGYGAIELVGWAEPPHYDSTTNKIYWGKEIKFGDSESNTLNYNIRVLGRKGYLVVNFIADMSQLSDINAKREEVLSLTEFTTGNRYEDFDSSTDNVAEYGIAALVAGVAAKKLGLLAGLLLLLKKFGVIAVVAIGALFAKLRRK